EGQRREPAADDVRFVSERVAWLPLAGLVLAPPRALVLNSSLKAERELNTPTCVPVNLRSDPVAKKRVQPSAQRPPFPVLRVGPKEMPIISVNSFVVKDKRYWLAIRSSELLFTPPEAFARSSQRARYARNSARAM